MKTSSIIKAGCAAVFALAAAGSSFAGEGNTLRLLQSNTSGNPLNGNSLRADQSAASKSLITGPAQSLESSLAGLGPEDETTRSTGSTLIFDSQDALVDDALRPARQIGQNNVADITLTGNGGQLQLLQNNDQTEGVGNSVTASIAAGALGATLQVGDRNQASLTLGAGATGLIGQQGFGNEGSLTVGAGGSGELVQNGSNNDYPLTVDARTQVTVTQNGNGLQPVGVTGAQVFATNPGVITIIQTGF